MSRRLFTVIVAALLMGVIFGGLRVADAEASAAQFSRTSQLANLGNQLVILVNDLQNERDLTLTDLTTDSTPPAPLQALFALTTAQAAAVRQAAAPVGGGFPANIQADVATALADISQSRILQLHKTINPTLPANELAAIANYGVAIGDMTTLAAQVSQGVSDATLATDVRALNALSLAKEQVSQQRALLNDAFFSPNDLANTMGALPIAIVEEAADEATFQETATPTQLSDLTRALGAPGVPLSLSMAQNIETNVIEANGVPTGNQTTPDVLEDLRALHSDLTGAQTAKDEVSGGAVGQPAAPLGATATGAAPTTLQQGLSAWDRGIGDELDAMQSTELTIAGNIATRAGQLQHSAERTALLYGIITAVVLLLVLLAALLVARSLVLPLRRLRAGALNIASVQLPERVKMLSESPETAATMEVAPINVVSEDEIGQVARAFDQVHAEAVRLAGEQALLRSSFNAMFVNLSRRSQSLIERLARTIDNLEQSEDDPDRLGSLFAMDHMVTRMRRNSENLLLLAGHENPRKWSDSIPLADVARAATSEIEQYNRVTLNIPPGIAVLGPAVSDVVHLIAELVENATIFSPKDTQVLLTMQELSSGGVLIEILDSGIGVSEARLTDMNFRLDNPPTIDVSVSRHMGLFAVARLAERHRVRVRLRPAAPQGLSALVWLPDSVIERTGRYNPVQGWSGQPASSPAAVGARPAGAELGFADSAGAPGSGGFAAAGAGYSGNGYNGGGFAGNSGFAGNAGGVNGGGPVSGGVVNGGVVNGGVVNIGGAFSGVVNGGVNGGGVPGAAGPMVREGREARAASGWFRGPLPGAGGGPATGPSPALGGAVPFAENGSAGEWGVRRIPGGSLAGSSFDQTATGLPLRGSRNGGQGSAGGDVPASSPGTGPQALPTRGSDPGRPTASRGPVPRGPGGGSHALPQRSPDQARSRLAGFQRGTRRAEERPGPGGQPSTSGQLGQAPGAGEGNER